VANAEAHVNSNVLPRFATRAPHTQAQTICRRASYRPAEVAGWDAPHCRLWVRSGCARAEAGLQTAKLAAPHAQRVCALPSAPQAETSFAEGSKPQQD